MEDTNVYGNEDESEKDVASEGSAEEADDAVERGDESAESTG